MSEGAAGAASLSVRLRQAGPIPLDVAFSSSAGELLALFGPSGSGKTTVLRSIAGLYSPREAFVRCGREVWTDTSAKRWVAPHRRSVGYVFQDYALFPHMSVRDQLCAAMPDGPAAARRKRLADLVALAQLQGLESRRPATLSGGQQQRVAIARALARDPAVLLLDEPFASVDRALRDALHREFQALRRSVSVPIVLVTHDFDDVARLASHLVFIERGHITASGTVPELTAANALPGVASWRDPGVVLDATLTEHDPARALSRVRVAGATLVVPRIEAATGDRVRLQIAAREVILASSPPQGVSLHNAVEGSCVSVDTAKRDLALVRVDANGMALLALVTRDAVRTLPVVPGQRLYALVKSVSIETFVTRGKLRGEPEAEKPGSDPSSMGR